MEGLLNRHKYIDNSHDHDLPFVDAKHGGTSIFKLPDDNCRHHRAGAVRFYMALHGLEHVD